VREAKEHPGVLAGCSVNVDLPQLHHGQPIPRDGYVWIPLARRMNLDRLYRSLVASDDFTGTQRFQLELLGWLDEFLI